MNRHDFQLVRRFARYYGPHRKLFALDMVMAVAKAGFAVLIPLLIRHMLAEYVPANDLHMIGVASAVLAGLIAAMSAADYVTVRWGHVVGARMETDMRADLFRHLQKLSFRYFDNTKTGHIMSRISNDLFTITEVAHHAPEDIFISGCMVAGGFAFMFAFSPPMAVLAAIPLPLMLLWGGFYSSRMRRGFRRVRLRIADINSNVENSIQGIREVKAFAKEDYAIGRFSEVNDEFRNAKEHMYGVMAGFHSGMLFFGELYYLCVIGGGAVFMSFGRATLPDIVACLVYVRFILGPIQRLVNFVEQFQQGAASFERFVEIMDEKPDITDRADAITPGDISGRICFDRVWFRYDQADDWALRDVTLCVDPGQTVALVGESGAGKSTLASLIPRFYEPQRGRILIDGHWVSQLTQRALRESIGIVQQNVFLFDTTIRENIMFGRPDASEEELVEAARNANIEELIRSLPQGFDTTVGEHGVKLSGGQRQRISIARVFLKDPPILVFDEATSSLDTESEAAIQEAMDRLRRDRTTIVIAHRLSTVQKADRTYALRSGRVVEEGTHAELLARKGYYYGLYAQSLF